MSRSWRSRLGVWLAVAGLVLAVTPGLGMAQSPDSSADPGNSAQGDGVAADPASGTSAAGAESGGKRQIGSLPFTGVDLLVLTGVAMVLTGTGLAMRQRFTHRRQSF